jgi:hypothetical protein
MKEKKKSDESKPAFVRAYEEDKIAEQKIVAMFNIDDFIKDIDALRQKQVEGIGIINYKRLIMADIMDIQKQFTDPSEQGLHVLTLMLQKADANVTYEKVCKLDPAVIASILSALTPELRFLTTKT